MNIVKKFITQLWYLLGAPRPPTPDQIGEKFVSMREARDCLVAAIATLCGVTYEQAYKACWHWNLIFFLESPLLANPLNAIRAIKSLGFSVDDSIDFDQLNSGTLPAGKVLVLVHDYKSKLPFQLGATLAQHWIVWGGLDSCGNHICHWGDGQPPHIVCAAEMQSYVKAGWPNCIILATKNE